MRVRAPGKFKSLEDRGVGPRCVLFRTAPAYLREVEAWLELGSGPTFLPSCDEKFQLSLQTLSAHRGRRAEDFGEEGVDPGL